MRNEREMRFDAASGAWFGKSKSIARAEMEGRLWRYGELVPSAPAPSSTARCPGTSAPS